MIPGCSVPWLRSSDELSCTTGCCCATAQRWGVDTLPPGEHPFPGLFVLAGRAIRLERPAHRRDQVSWTGSFGSLQTMSDSSLRSTTTVQNRQVGNTPQALTHLALVRAATAIDRATISQALHAGTGGKAGALSRMSVTPAQRLARIRLASQWLVGSRATSPADVVRSMMAMQAQDFAGAKWAVGLRLPASTEAQVDRALADGTIVRSWPMRGTSTSSRRRTWAGSWRLPLTASSPAPRAGGPSSGWTRDNSRRRARRPRRRWVAVARSPGAK